MRTILRRPVAALFVAFLVVVGVAALAAPLLTPWDPTTTDLEHVLSGPTALHPLGTDSLGRDVLSRLMFGGRISLVGVAEAVLVLLVLGVPTGLVVGYVGGWADRITSWVTDIVLAMPGIVVLLVVLAIFGTNSTAAMITVGALGAPFMARVVRGATLAVRAEPYVAAARVAGLRPGRIVLGQILPRVTGPILVQTALAAGSALVVQTGLSYLGLIAEPPTPTWGGMVADGSQVIDAQPWLLFPPGLVIGLAVLAFGLLGDAIRDATAERVTRPGGRVRPGPKRTDEPAPADPSQLLSVRGLVVSLPAGGTRTSVVEDVSLDIAPGETVGLVGESGCGKSVTARSLLGLLPAGGRVDGGRVVFDGRDLVGLSTRDWKGLRGRRIGLVSQEPVGSLDPMFTVGHQVGELVRRHHGGSRRAARSRALELLASVRLPDPAGVARRYPHELSGGMAQRVAIALALAGDPDLLIADEPTTALDVTVQAEILELLAGLQQARGMAILLISHDWGVVAAHCRRVYVMYAGHVVETAPVGELLTEPRHPYTAGLLGCAPRRARPRTPLHPIPGVVPELGHRPGGCPFHPRCALATADCATGTIPAAEPEPGHHTWCLHHTELAKEGDDEPAVAGRS
ncbi:dipeptide/oligopeptide/nickel ABC transporter permease/ATP-binding protein [Actinophytocola sp.]|uniref:dipeptide/oligopeptide/nickel ABC transporter permease/ATP-binding protein n=1 Tax=Actinophytocola sp. TaxID=1872138 RepID=UPI002EDB2CA3